MATETTPDFTPGEITGEMSDCAHLCIKGTFQAATRADVIAGREAFAHLFTLTTGPKAHYIVRAIRSVCYT